MALRSLVKSPVGSSSTRTSVAQLYRSMLKELPRVLAIYDIDMPNKEARAAVSYHFRKHSAVQNPGVISLLLAKGYMELEETLMQWKQKTHLLRLLEPPEMIKENAKELTEREKFILGIDQ